jgi:hypothetical protein
MAQSRAAGALAQLARFNRENQDSAARQGGLPLLVGLLPGTSGAEVQVSDAANGFLVPD